MRGEAIRMMADMLARHDPATAPPDAQLIAAALLYGRVVDGPTSDPDDLAWAGYARRAARVLYGLYHQTTVAARRGYEDALIRRIGQQPRPDPYPLAGKGFSAEQAAARARRPCARRGRVGPVARCGQTGQRPRRRHQSGGWSR